MKIELSVTNSKDLSDALKMDVDAVNFGNEGCGYRIPKVDKLIEIIHKVENNNMECRLTLPFITQRFYESILDNLRLIAEKREKTLVTANDYGILYAVSKESWGKNIGWVTGRHLGGSYSQVPWHEYLLKDEAPSIQKQMKAHAMTNQTIIDFLKDYGVVGVEGNSLLDEMRSLRYVKERGLKVYVRAEYSPVFTGNVCTTSRYLKKPPPSCSAYCDEVLTLELTDILSIQGDSMNRPDWVEKVPTFYAHGNMLYHYTPLIIDKSDTEIIDYISFELRNYKRDELLEKIENSKIVVESSENTNEEKVTPSCTG